jgi:hypothetical protein
VADAYEGADLLVPGEYAGAGRGHQERAIHPLVRGEGCRHLEPQLNSERVGDDDTFAVAELGEFGVH